MKTTTANEKNPVSVEEINDAWEKSVKKIERQIVAYLSRGSAALAQGRYQTKEDIDKLREEVLNYNFDK
jgi:hypothetical protein